MKKVCSINACWIFALMLIIPGSVIHAEEPPSDQEQAVREAQQVAATPVPPALHQALASSLSEAASFGAKTIPTPPTGSWGIVSEGDGGGGIFRDTNSEAEAWLGSDGWGVQGYGSWAGGKFKDSNSDSEAIVAYATHGILAAGPGVGGLFKDSDDSGQAYAGYGDRGIQASGNEMGGYFTDADGSGHAALAIGDRGLSAGGNEAGGYFYDRNGSGTAYVGYANQGIYAYGGDWGGYFIDSNSSGIAYVARGDKGIFASGSDMGGNFVTPGGSGYAEVAYADYGIRAYGNAAGGVFEDRNSNGYAFVGMGTVGISAWGDYAGGIFNDLNSSASLNVAYDTYKIQGTGSVSFIQNHPYDPSSVIVYAAPEGDEVATYTRGTARLIDGEATVPLGETFKWVTNPDIGLTAHLTPRGEPVPLAVAGLTTEEMIVHAPDDVADGLIFDYLVYGLRIGFEESSVVQEKEQEAYIPSMSSHRDLYDRRPDLRRYSALERFKESRRAVGKSDDLDLSGAQNLRDAIVEFDPEIHELPRPPGHEETTAVHGTGGDDNHGEGVQARDRLDAVRSDQDRRPAPVRPGLSATIAVDDDGNVYAPSFRPSSRDVANLVDVSEAVEPGDVLVIDRDQPRMMRRGFEAHDMGVIGVVAADAGLVLGKHPPLHGHGEITDGASRRAAVALAGGVDCKVDAAYGAIWPGDLLVTSPTPGHAMRTDSPLPGTTLGKALEPLEDGTGVIRVLVMLR